jgi:hypothetical protein
MMPFLATIFFTFARNFAKAGDLIASGRLLLWLNPSRRGEAHGLRIAANSGKEA